MFRASVAAFLVVLYLGSAEPAHAQGKFNKKLKIGDACPTFADLPGTDGKTHSLADLKDKEVVVLAITTNHCAIAISYEKRIIDFVQKHAGPESKIGFVAVNVNTQEIDRLPKMTERVADKGFNFTYLFDESQKLGRELGATVTPEFFVLNKERRIVYMGALDDNNLAKAAKTNYLEAAVTAALKGETPAVTETMPRGCVVNYAK
jgi:peroxiredoxin